MPALDIDAQVRVAAFAFLEDQTRQLGEVLPWAVLSNAFQFQGERVLGGRAARGRLDLLAAARDAVLARGAGVAAGAAVRGVGRRIGAASVRLPALAQGDRTCRTTGLVNAPLSPAEPISGPWN